MRVDRPCAFLLLLEGRLEPDLLDEGAFEASSDIADSTAIPFFRGFFFRGGAGSGWGEGSVTFWRLDLLEVEEGVVSLDGWVGLDSGRLAAFRFFDEVDAGGGGSVAIEDGWAAGPVSLAEERVTLDDIRTHSCKACSRRIVGGPCRSLRSKTECL